MGFGNWDWTFLFNVAVCRIVKEIVYSHGEWQCAGQLWTIGWAFSSKKKSIEEHELEVGKLHDYRKKKNGVQAKHVSC